MDDPKSHGYPSQISLLAGYMIDLKLDRPECVKIITIGSETLTPAQRTVIQKAFGVRVRQHYGLAEGVANISEDSNGRLQVDADFSYVEFIPVSDDTPECCRIIGTNLNNNAFPLIRYDSGDVATITRPPHDFIIHAIDGRIEDFLTLKNGTKVGRLSMLYNFVAIREMQIRQHRPGRASFWIVKGTNYDERTEEARLQRYVSERFGNLLDYDIKYVDSIPKTTSGKLRLVVSSPSDSEG